MARLPPPFIAEVLSRVDVVEIIGQRLPLKRVGGSYRACCPFHAEKTPSFHVHPVKQRYYCFGCHAHGDAITFLVEHDRLPFLEAVTQLAEQVNLPLPTGSVPLPDARLERLKDYHTRAELRFRQQLLAPTGDLARQYLDQRGVDEAMQNRFGLGYATAARQGLLSEFRKQGVPLEELLTAGLVVRRDDGSIVDRFRDRLMFPIRDSKGQTIAFGGRTLSPEGQPKYLNSSETPIFHKGNCLFGLFEARQAHPRPRRFVVVEGYLDVISLVQRGIEGVVAPLGTAISTEQIEQLFRNGPHLTFCFDGDRAGRDAAFRAMTAALPTLRQERHIDFLTLPEGEDPDSFVGREGASGFLHQLDQAVPFADFFFTQLTQGLDLSSLHGRSALLQQARPLLKQLSDGPLKEVLQAELSQRAKVIEKPPTLPTPPKSKPKAFPDLERSPLPFLMALLLHQPALVEEVTTSCLDNLRFLAINDSHAQHIIQIIEFIRQQPHVPHAAALLVHLEGDESLNELVCWEPPPEFPLSAAFWSVLQNVEQAAKRERQLNQWF